jgi:hypothetical protein
MTTASFQVALTGLIDGHAADDVAHRLALLFKQPPERMRAILDGKRRVLKRGLSEAAARRYVAALQAAGCTCVVSEDLVATLAHAAEPIPSAIAGSQGRNFYDGARPVGTTAAMAARDAGAEASAAVATSAEEFRVRQKQLRYYQMGAGQKLLITAILLNFAYAALQKQLGLLPALLASLAVVAVMISGLLSMCRGLCYSGAKRIALVLLMFVPLLGLVAMVAMSLKASRALKEEGVHVGLLGASSDQLSALAAGAGLPAGTRPRVAMASVAVLLVFAGCFAVSSHYRDKAEQAAALALSKPCELAGVWDISSRLGDFTLTLQEDGRMLSTEGKSGDWRFEAGELLLTEGTRNTSTTHYRILRATDGYALERMGVAHTMMLKQRLSGKRCKT